MKGSTIAVLKQISKAKLVDLSDVVTLVDSEFTKEGFGFVNKAQIETEINKGRVIVARENGIIIGCRIGIDTVWNMVVTKSKRGQGVGKTLIEYIRPRTIRVKNTPIGHLSKAQRDKFPDPTGFYEAMGYRFWGSAYPRNFWQRAGDKAKFHSRGELPHIAVYKDERALLGKHVMRYTWHGIIVNLICRAPFHKGVKRNCRILLPNGSFMIVPLRALRKLK